MKRHQTVSEMAEEVLLRQAMALANGNGHSLEDAREAVSDTEAGRQLRDLANGEHGHEKAHAWQASVFWERAEQRWMHRIGSEILSRFCSRTPLYSRVENTGSAQIMTPEQARSGTRVRIMERHRVEE